MAIRHPRTLSVGDHNAVVAISDDLVGKLFTADTRSDIGSEASKMRFANGVNDLVVKYKRLETQKDGTTDVLVMERLYPMDFRAYEVERRELWFDVFETELAGLHEAGFAHRDLRRPSEMPGYRYDHIFLTQRGLRLIDVGISALREQVGSRLFERFVEREREELELFRQKFLSR